jgi:DNA-binding response OmpR family regulator
LLVDDEEVVRDTLQLLLQRAGYRVFPAENVRAGIQEFERRKDEIALVITDMMLPDQVGTELVKVLRKSRASLPIIAISGMMDSGRYDELTRLTPAVECLAKPLSPATLLSAVRRGLPAKS